MLKVLLLVVLHISLLHKNGVAETTTDRVFSYEYDYISISTSEDPVNVGISTGVAETTTDRVFSYEYDYISISTSEDPVNVGISTDASNDIANVYNEIKINDVDNANEESSESTQWYSFSSSTSTSEFSSSSTTVGILCVAPHLRYSNFQVYWEFENSESCGEIAYVNFVCNKLYNDQEDIETFNFNATNERFWNINKDNKHLQTGIQHNCEVYASDEFKDRISKSTYIIVPPGSLGAAGEGGKRNSYQLFTAEDTPSPSVSITDKGPTYFTIEWNIKKSLISYNYSVEIKNLGANYDRNSHCPDYPDPDVYYTNETTYNFTDARPFYKYIVTVTVSPDTKSQKAEPIMVITNPSEPDEVANLTFRVDNETLLSELQWELPCDVNGLISNFVVTRSEKYTEDEQEESKTYIIPKTDFSKKWQLKPSHVYNINISIILEDGLKGDNATVLNYTTESGLPGLPGLLVRNVSNTSFQINWSRPVEKTGPIEYYELLLVRQRPLYPIPRDCNVTNETIFMVFDGNSSNYAYYSAFPDHHYTASLRANTTRGFGNYSYIGFNTDIGEPETVRNVNKEISTHTYVSNVLFSFDPPCNAYGTIKYYSFEYEGYREPYENVTAQYRIFPGGSKISFNLKPEFVYNYQIKTFNEKFYSVYYDQFKAPAEAPKINLNVSISVENVTIENAQIVLKKEYFDFFNGDIKYVALLLSESVLNNETHEWNFGEWPDLEKGTQQLTNCFWNPFESSNETVFTIGVGSNCTPPCVCKNGVLKDNTRYILTIRAFNSNFYGNIKSIAFITDKISHLAVILGVIFGILFFLVLALVGFFVWKKKLYKKITYISPRKSSNKSIEFSSTAVPPKRFIQYFRNTENRPEVLKAQFDEILEKSKEIQAQNTCHFAGLVENKRKNRYSNISPYDDTRVKLLIDEDDEIGSDYINASYIKGYSGAPEYIATQGPLPTTCRDFWKMVIQENVSIIVMVAQFVENNKDKCYKYFPKNHENLIISDDLEIRCSTELHFGTYLVRNLQVRKDCHQVTVTHMQFLEWPDFNVPTGTEHMLQFIYKMRERLKLENGLVIVHCSAGVGRTGTLIAADMLLQNADSGRQIDVFDIVLGLRTQRTCMVQTLEQYIYLHRLVADHIDRPLTPDLNETNDPVYENMDILKNKPESPMKGKELESKF